MERLLTTTALGLALAVTPALADTMTKPNTTDNQSSRTGVMEQPGTSGTPDTAHKPSTVRQPGAASIEFLKQPNGQQQLASKLIGKAVYGPKDEQIGDVDDLVMSRDGRIVAAVIGVGGFLGISEKDVAVNYTAVQTSKTANGEVKVMLDVSKETLESAPQFEMPAQSAKLDSKLESEKTASEMASAIVEKLKKAME